MLQQSQRPRVSIPSTQINLDYLGNLRICASLGLIQFQDHQSNYKYTKDLRTTIFNCLEIYASLEIKFQH
jgi:hypothetical protein